MKLSSIANTLKLLYADKIDLTRSGKVTNSDATTSVGYGAPHVLKQACKISFAHAKESKSIVDKNVLTMLPKIFCASSTDVKAGDKVIAYRLNDAGDIVATYEGYCGEPVHFKSHIEFVILATWGA